MSANNNVPSNCNPNGGWLEILNCGSGTAAANEGQTANTFFAALATAVVSFAVQILIFVLLRLRLSRIYRPRSYLVPEKERVPIPPAGIVAWLGPLFSTPNLAFIQKCGLDAYFFLRYLRMLLKIFFPIALVAIPILLPINRYSGNNKGLDKLSISNIMTPYKSSRLWAHLIIAVLVIFWIQYVIYRELRGYIRVRQAYLTSPQHRIRASATTVLVTGIPHKWLTPEALNGLYDVFPGGIRNIWINRNFDELGDKVSYRDSLAKSLEGAETDLIKKCWKKHAKDEKQRLKDAGGAKKSKAEKKEDHEAANADAERMAHGQGMSAGDQHDRPHDIQEALYEAEEAEERHAEQERKKHNPLGLVGEGFGAIGQGLGNFGREVGGVGQNIGKFGKNVVGDVDEAFDRANQNIERAGYANAGFVIDDDVYRSPDMSLDVPPTPPPKTPMEERNMRLQDNKASSAGKVAQEKRISQVGQHPLATIVSVPGEHSPSSDKTQVPPSVRQAGPSIESTKPLRSPMEIEVPPSHMAKRQSWKIWKNHDHAMNLPSPQPHIAEEDEFPFSESAQRKTPNVSENAAQEESKSKVVQQLVFWKKGKDEEEKPKDVYPDAFNKDSDEDQDEQPFWLRYLEPKERDTMRIPIFSPTWCPSIPLIGKRVDKIYWLRRELARLNLEIETDQNDVEKFPYMNSAFIQFNHQVAAHMACQTLSHHVPQHMAPRLVEISPDDVLWDNMSIKWWERYLRTGIVLAVCIGLIILYAVPVTFTGLLSHISTLSEFPAFKWLKSIPTAGISFIQGALPPLVLSIILTLVPIVFRLLIKQQGVPTGNSQELGVQNWYFAFLFIQVFLVVTISTGLISFITAIAKDPTAIVKTLATSLPKASNYFFSYLMVQALSNGASSLLQVGALVAWFLLASLFDSTARQKWRRQTTLSNVQWGSFFPVFTNFAVIGIIYSVIAPLILVFMIIIFGMFWIVYRYNVLYVYQFRNDTGGLLFPVAVNQLFVGLYFMELCLVGYFFISTNGHGDLVTLPQAIIMIVMLLGTITFQLLLNRAFKPLFQYLPITLEDEAVIRDEEFARAQASKFEPQLERVQSPEDARDIQDVLEEREQAEADDEERAVDEEKRDIDERRRSQRDSSLRASTVGTAGTPKGSWHHNSPRQGTPSWHNSGSSRNLTPTWKTDRWRAAAPEAVARIRHLAHVPSHEQNHDHEQGQVHEHNVDSAHPQRHASVHHDVKTADISTIKAARHQDLEAQKTVGDVLFSGFADELEDLTPDERDLLVRYAFQHSALRAKRPVVWVPRDQLGVSDDEIRRAKWMSTIRVSDSEKGGEVEKTNIWMSNEGTALDWKGRVVFRRSPPDFSNVDLIAL